MVVICRIELDNYSLDQIEHFVIDGIVTLSEARQSKAVMAMGEYNQVLWVRRMQAARQAKAI